MKGESIPNNIKQALYGSPKHLHLFYFLKIFLLECELI